jgi:CrcB protein
VTTHEDAPRCILFGEPGGFADSGRYDNVARMKLLAAIALGGAIGALGRHFVAAGMVAWFGHGFPVGTLVVNVLGSFIMGALVETMALVWSPPLEMRALLTVGLLGAFTTFSTFSLDVVTLYQRGEAGPAAFYIAASFVLSVGALFAGMRLLRLVLA